MPKGIYECVDCGHRELFDSSEPVLEKACPRCGGDMVLVGLAGESGKGQSGPSTPKDLEEKLREFYDLELNRVEGNLLVFEVREILERDFERVLGELEKIGYWAALKKRNDNVLLFVFPAQEVKEEKIWLPLVFLMATILTTFLAGYYLSLGYVDFLNTYGLPGVRDPYLNAVAFSVALLAIIGTHELGHKIAAAYHGVKATMPYFIPFPNILGTLGAVIRVKSPLPTRNAAIDLGVSGPIAGFLVAIPVTVIGLRLSVVVPSGTLSQAPGGSIVFGTNLLFVFLEEYVLKLPQNADIFLHPVAIAGWVGILVTFLNLIPVAQLDGGHIARSFLDERTHRYLTMAVGFVLLGMSYLWAGWLIWGMLVLLMGSFGNPGPLDEVSPVSKGRLLLVILSVVIFLVSATPRPLWATG
ncbi:metalloprotease [Thermococcus sp. P6]|uniref:site-2 protease family protein n=1 Tax=Thermococcus sp. P6 TaxID=122420 RepID=UPI000B59DCF0|nr:site-2 protease family protein [Thermococcus sp. P6]ASJ10805.1 metalloprotease [Thermococcus sp. P6]